MAAAEYYNATAAAQGAPQYSPYSQSPHQQSPYQQSPLHQSPYQRPHELHGSPIPQYSLPQGSPQSQQGPPPPPYYPNQQDSKPGVHFAPTPSPLQQNRPSRPNSGRPSFSSQAPSNHGQFLQPAPHHSSYAQHGAPSKPSHIVAQPPHMRPYVNGNQSEYSLGNGYASDPEPRRRRRHKRHEQKDDHESSREVRPKKDRSRSTNADSFLGAAGGGLIGDMIFPGLGTVGGAVAGWLGGRNYGKHREQREEKLHREQKEWEHRFGSSRSRSRSGSRDRRHSDDHRNHRKVHQRHNSDY